MAMYTHHHLLIQGSSVARQASEKEKTKELPMYKDNDFVSEGIKIHIGASAKQRLMNILKADTDVSYFSSRAAYYRANLCARLQNFLCWLRYVEFVHHVCVQFLTNLNMMDYSLLVGIHDMDSSGGPDLAGPAETDRDELSDDDGEDEEAGGDQDSPPDSPEPGGVAVRFAPPSFSGELDPYYERFGIKCSPGT